MNDNWLLENGLNTIMRRPFLLGYLLIGVLILWSLIAGNYEFVIYAGATIVLLGFLHWTDQRFHYNNLVLWLFDSWLVMHILGGLLVVGSGVLYSFVLIPIVGEPYDILKYDQLVHTYCYFVVALLVWKVVTQVARPDASHRLLAAITVLAATGIGGLNEMVEFLAVIAVPDTNVGGYENTAIDIVANFLGALLAVPLFRKYR